MTEAQRLAAALTAKKRRFVLAASARRPKTYASIRRHARRGDGWGLRELFTEVRAERRRRRSLRGVYVLSPFGVAVKRALEEVRHG